MTQEPQTPEPQELWLVSFASNAPNLFSAAEVHLTREAALTSAEALIVDQIETDSDTELDDGVDESGKTVEETIENVRQQFAEAKGDNVFVSAFLNTDRLHLEWQVEISRYLL